MMIEGALMTSMDCWLTRAGARFISWIAWLTLAWNESVATSATRERRKSSFEAWTANRNWAFWTADATGLVDVPRALDMAVL